MKPKLNLLVAYPYVKKSIINHLVTFERENPECLRFFLDSGAFTAHSSGKPIALDDYCRFIENLPIKPWNYFALDVIGDEDATVKNYEKMLERGFNPTPIFTHGSDYDVIDFYYSKTDFIAYGGLVGIGKNNIIAGVDKFQKKIAGRKAHLLGYTSMSAIKYFKPYSCDSSSWECGARFGRGDIYLGSGRMLGVKKLGYIEQPAAQVIAACKKLKIDIRRAQDNSQWKGGESFIRDVGGASWVRMSVDVEKNIKTKLFLAFATQQAGKILTDAYTRLI